MRRTKKGEALATVKAKEFLSELRELERKHGVDVLQVSCDNWEHGKLVCGVGIYGFTFEELEAPV